LGIFIGFVPWIVYWVLIGNTSFLTSSLVAAALFVLQIVIDVRKKRQPKTLEIGGLIFFAVMVVVALFTNDSDVERWVSPLSTAAILVIAVIGVLAGRPFVRDYAVETVSPEIAQTESFRRVTVQLTWVWIAAFAVMTVSSFIPPIVDGEATIRDDADALSIICYWIIPFAAVGLAAVISKTYPARVHRDAVAGAR
jgi:UDP-N-acetylmuramyl pentapeptide phosphotransferase/UDP-N-acetylglucosamine-1-phosphate transferase